MTEEKLDKVPNESWWRWEIIFCLMMSLLLMVALTTLDDIYSILYKLAFVGLTFIAADIMFAAIARYVAISEENRKKPQYIIMSVLSFITGLVLLFYQYNLFESWDTSFISVFEYIFA